MGQCIDCVYHKLEVGTPQPFDEKWKKEFRKNFSEIPYNPNEHHLCECPQYIKTDYVSGKRLLTECYDKNLYGECLFFEQVEDDTEEDNSEITENSDEENSEEEVNNEETFTDESFAESSTDDPSETENSDSTVTEDSETDND